MPPRPGPEQGPPAPRPSLAHGTSASQSSVMRVPSPPEPSPAHGASEPLAGAPPPLRIARLLLYPVKGLGGIEIEEGWVEFRGIAGDRRFMLVDATGTFLSQRTHPAMARVRTALVAGGGSPTRLRLTHPERAPLEVEATPGTHDAGGRPRPTLPVTVWGSELEAVAPSPEADAWFSGLLGAPVRLVWQPQEARRPTDPAWAPEAEVSLADGYPLLVVTEASLEGLNARLETPLPMDRFRPNVIVAGAAPHAEDRWRRLHLGEVPMAGVKRCARCSVTTVDQATGEQGKEPLRTLATYRRGAGGKVYFGQNLVPLAEGRVRVGDPVQVEEEGEVGPE